MARAKLRPYIIAIPIVAVVAVGGYVLLRGFERLPGSGEYERTESVQAASPSTDSVSVMHGRDTVVVHQDGEFALVCDMEGDGNPVKANLEVLDGDGTTDRVQILDDDGARGTCERLTPEAPIVNHQVCERNHIVWDCSNWQAVESEGDAGPGRR